MTIRNIVYFPSKILRQNSEEITNFDKTINQLALDMIETMQEYNGVGLAAIQIGIPLRMFIIDKAAKNEESECDPLVVINPKITWCSSELNTYNEGCLSVPEIYEEVQRPAQINMQYYTLENKIEEIKLEGLMATCAQHELDHLNGILFFDHLSKIKKDRLINKFLKKQNNEA